MSSIIDHRGREHTMRQALRRTVKFNMWALLALLALFSVLAVKAQVAQADRVAPWNYETTR